MALAVYDAHSRILTLANAGSPRPLLIRDGVTEVVRVEGIPLGLFPEAQYEEVSLLLRPGDIVILASDGIHEAENTEKEQFGVERLAAAVFDLARDTSAATIAGQILRVTDEHSAGECEFQDDRTILVLRITDEPVAGDDWSKIHIGTGDAWKPPRSVNSSRSGREGRVLICHISARRPTSFRRSSRQEGRR